MTAFSQQLESLNPDKELDQQSTIVSIDKSNLRNWKKLDEAKRLIVLPNEREIVTSITVLPSVKKVKVYANLPEFIEKKDVKSMEVWLSEHYRQELVNIKLQMLSDAEYVKKLAMLISEFEEPYLVGKRIRSRANYVLSQIVDREVLDDYKRMGVDLILKKPKIQLKTMVGDSGFEYMVRRMIDEIEKMQILLKMNSFDEENEMVDTVLDELFTNLKSVEDINEEVELTGDAKMILALVKAEMGRMADQITSIKIIEDEQRRVVYSIVSLMVAFLEKIKGIMLFEQFSVNKCDLDAEIIVDNLDSQILSKYDNFVFLSGDGDFAVLYKKLFSLGKKIMVVATEKKLGKEIVYLEKTGVVQVHNPFDNQDWWMG